MAHLSINWGHPAPEGLTFNLYENGNLIVTDIGVMTFDLDMNSKTTGSYTYYGTSVRTSDGVESIPSESVVINFTQDPPVAPTGFSASLVE